MQVGKCWGAQGDLDLPCCCLAEAFCGNRRENVLFRGQVDSFSLNLTDSLKSGDH